MNQTELAIIVELAQLDEVQQAIILEHTRQLATERLTAHKGNGLGDWLVDAQRLRAQVREQYGDHHYFNTQTMLDEIREEESE